MDYGKPVLVAKNEKGQVAIYRPLKDLVVTVSEGFITRDLWAPQQPVYEAILNEVPTLRVYRDAWNVRSVESEYTGPSQGFIKARREKFSEIVFLQRSAVIALAINTAALFSRAPLSAVGKDAWDQKLDAALHGKKAA
jgi:hypothetical protein